MSFPILTRIKFAIERIQFRWPVVILPAIDWTKVGQSFVNDARNQDVVAKMTDKELGTALITEVWGQFKFGTMEDALIGEAINRLLPKEPGNEPACRLEPAPTPTGSTSKA